MSFGEGLGITIPWVEAFGVALGHTRLRAGDGQGDNQTPRGLRVCVLSESGLCFADSALSPSARRG